MIISFLKHSHCSSKADIGVQQTATLNSWPGDIAICSPRALAAARAFADNYTFEAPIIRRRRRRWRRRSRGSRSSSDGGGRNHSRESGPHSRANGGSFIFNAVHFCFSMCQRLVAVVGAPCMRYRGQGSISGMTSRRDMRRSGSIS